jgi:hypothetical protein
MRPKGKLNDLARRVAKHRQRLMRTGTRRIEVSVPEGDTQLVRAVAKTLRSGGEAARSARAAIAPLVDAKTARTGKDLVAFFRSSPLVGIDLKIERDRSPGRKVDF